MKWTKEVDKTKFKKLKGKDGDEAPKFDAYD